MCQLVCILSSEIVLLFVNFPFPLFPERTPSECLLQLKDVLLIVITESDYNTIAKDYKRQPFENEHNQVVRWCALIRMFFHRRQATHNHHTAEKGKTLIGKSLVNINKKKKLLSLEKLSGSFDNLRDIKVRNLCSMCVRVYVCMCVCREVVCFKMY